MFKSDSDFNSVCIEFYDYFSACSNKCKKNLKLQPAEHFLLLTRTISRFEIETIGLNLKKNFDVLIFGLDTFNVINQKVVGSNLISILGMVSRDCHARIDSNPILIDSTKKYKLR